MSFLRRISNAANSFFPNIPNTSGDLPRHVPRRATETYSTNKAIEEDDDVASKFSRASWEMSDSESIKSSIASVSSKGDSGSESESDSDDEVEDKYDMMVRHLWGVGERSGWFRDAEFDGLVSIR